MRRVLLSKSVTSSPAIIMPNFTPGKLQNYLKRLTLADKPNSLLSGPLLLGLRPGLLTEHVAQLLHFVEGVVLALCGESCGTNRDLLNVASGPLSREVLLELALVLLELSPEKCFTFS